VDLAAERTRLQKEIDNIDKQLQRIDGLLGNAGFVAKAPAEVIERERSKQDELQSKRGQLAERLADLNA
jgi:valyl-tRNA synthetase